MHYSIKSLSIAPSGSKSIIDIRINLVSRGHVENAVRKTDTSRNFGGSFTMRIYSFKLSTDLFALSN